MSETMELSKETLETIGAYVKGNLPSWLREMAPLDVRTVDPQLLERIVRVEDSLDNQLKLIERGFDQVDKRFQQVEKRLDQVDKRFEEQREDFISRFDRVDKRFDQVDKRFEEQREDFISRFDRVDKRFEEVRQDMNARFQEQRDAFNARFDDISKHNRRSTALQTTILSVVALLIGYATLIA